MNITVKMSDITGKELALLEHKLQAYKFDEFNDKTHEFNEAKQRNNVYTKKTKFMQRLFMPISASCAVLSIGTGMIMPFQMTGPRSLLISFGTLCICGGSLLYAFSDEFFEGRRKKMSSGYQNFDIDEYYKNTLSANVYQWYFLTRHINECKQLLDYIDVLTKWQASHKHIKLNENHTQIIGIHNDTLQEEILDVGILTAYIDEYGTCDLTFITDYVDAAQKWIEENPTTIEIPIEKTAEEEVSYDVETALKMYISKHETDYRYDSICSLLKDIKELLLEIKKENISKNTTIYMDVLIKLIKSYDELTTATVQTASAETAKQEIIETVIKTKEAFTNILAEHKESEAMEIISEANALQQKYMLDGVTGSAYAKM